jgi:hypothetical protein
MPRPRPPHLLREVSRHRTVRWVVRIGHGPRIPIPGKYGTPEFEAAYHAVRGDLETPKKPGADQRSLRFLVERWQASSDWAALAVATRRQRVNILKSVLNSAGDKPYLAITRAHVIAGRETRARTPAQANIFIKVMRALYRWAIDQEFVAADPTKDVGLLKEAAPGFPAWTNATFSSSGNIGRLDRANG